VSADVTLAVFDLDHTLIDADTDQLWCHFLIDEGVVQRRDFAARNAAMEREYRLGRVTPQAFCDFYVGTLTGRSPEDWAPVRDQFVRERVLPSVKPGTAALLAQHRAQGHTLVMSTATNRFLTEPTAAALGLPHLLATDCEVGADGRFTGRTVGTLNMRGGKVVRLQAWLAERHGELETTECYFYSDSINDLPLLQAARHARVVDPDAGLRAEAEQRGWPVLSLRHR
jgi:HAD superfamily hydrolase (TIGR01490 family)